MPIFAPVDMPPLLTAGAVGGGVVGLAAAAVGFVFAGAGVPVGAVVCAFSAAAVVRQPPVARTAMVVTLISVVAGLTVGAVVEGVPVISTRLPTFCVSALPVSCTTSGELSTCMMK